MWKLLYINNKNQSCTYTVATVVIGSHRLIKDFVKERKKAKHRSTKLGILSVFWSCTYWAFAEKTVYMTCYFWYLSAFGKFMHVMLVYPARMRRRTVWLTEILGRPMCHVSRARTVWYEAVLCNDSDLGFRKRKQRLHKGAIALSNGSVKTRDKDEQTHWATSILYENKKQS